MDGHKSFKSIFLHFFDIHFLQQKGLNHPHELILNECRLATRLSIIYSDVTIVPAASFVESPICSKILMEHKDLFQFGAIEIAGNAIHLPHFREKKLLSYSENSLQYMKYSGLDLDIITPPFRKRQRSATLDITEHWKTIEIGQHVPNLEKRIGGRIPKNIDAHWLKVPEILLSDSKAFIVDHVTEVLGNISFHPLFKNFLHTVINKGYFSSYTSDFQSGLISELIYLDSGYEIPSHGGNLPYRRLIKVLNRNGLLESLRNSPPFYLLEARKNSRWIQSFQQAMFPMSQGKSSDTYVKNKAFWTGLDVKMKEEKPIFKTGYGLIIGVGADLACTVKDAIGLRDLLVDFNRCAYPTNQVRLLTEDKAKRKDILDGLDWLAEKTQNNSDATVVVYFSGHGGKMPHYHLVPYGYNLADLTGTSISGSEFTEKLRAIHSKKLLVLLDCCHAGGIGDVKASTFEKSPIPPEFEEIFIAGSGRVVIASSRKDEFSLTGNPYSVFTQALQEGLAGYGAAEQDGYSYMTDVALYVGRMVPNRTGEKQHPILKLSQADNFAIAYYAGGEKSIKPLSTAENAPILPAPIEDSRVAQYRRILDQYQQNLLAVEFQMAAFIDQRTVPLDLICTKESILCKISETESKIVDTSVSVKVDEK